ncbi:hypothetical protein [Xenorhabdus japonica]|uniref:Uncharacterized protein n=1 Tax=Xenorhabdus japonica TaxID=53341 RepID=A0A1I5BB12_9GAMM|nr:hypothetical protein [Xenorhabdus japonica]SFN71830.1 hypothetical protein SAMN05421579_11716 [Xenorhabdus japonica]
MLINSDQPSFSHKSRLFYLPDYFLGLEGPWQQPFLWGGPRRSTHNEIPCVQGTHRSEILLTIVEMLFS